MFVNQLVSVSRELLWGGVKRNIFFSLPLIKRGGKEKQDAEIFGRSLLKMVKR